MIIDVNQLRKSYGDTEAVKGINFEVEKGQFFAFLGENGAGKSTTINIISTLLEKYEGEVTINHHLLGRDNREIRKDIGVVFQDNMLDDFLTVYENMIIRGSLYNIESKMLKSRIQSLMVTLEAGDIMDCKYGKLSGGQRRKADIMRALIHQPKILILDEPTTGLDPSTRQKVWNTIEEIRKDQGITLFLTTHYLEEAAQADQIVVISEGKIIASGTPEMLRIQYSNDRLVLIPNEMSTVVTHLNHLNRSFHKNNNRVIVPISTSFEAIGIVQQLEQVLSGFEVIQGSLEDAFIAMVNKEISYD